MEYIPLDEIIDATEQQLINVERKGFIVVE